MVFKFVPFVMGYYTCRMFSDFVDSYYRAMYEDTKPVRDVELQCNNKVLKEKHKSCNYKMIVDSKKMPLRVFYRPMIDMLGKNKMNKHFLSGRKMSCVNNNKVYRPKIGLTRKGRGIKY